MTPIRQFLRFLSRHATVLLAVGVLLGLFLPSLAALLRPYLELIVIFNLATALVRLDFGEVAGFARRPLLVLLAIAAMLIVSPIIMKVLVAPGYLAAGLAAALVLMAAAPPITSAPAFALILGLDAAFSVFVVIACHVLVPFTLPPLAVWLLGIDLELTVAELMLRLMALVGSSLLITMVLKVWRRSARVIAKNGAEIEGLSVFGLVIFAIAIMDGVPALALARPEFAAITVAAAFVANVGLQVIGALGFWAAGRRIALTVGHMTGNCNMGLVLAVLGNKATPEIAFFFALAQLPMYMLPSVALPIYRRLFRAADAET